jgi:hypothetical protein
MNAAGLAQNIEIGIVLVHLPVRNFHALRPARDPAVRQRTRTHFHASCVYIAAREHSRP